MPRQSFVIRDLISGYKGASLADFVFANQGSDFLGELDGLRDEVDALAYLEAQLVGSSAAVSAGLSVGYVLWLTRGGLLIASVISSLPAWALIDPVPILARLGVDDDEDDDESLDSMVSRGSSPAQPKLREPEASESARERGLEFRGRDADEVSETRDTDRRGAR